MLIKGTALVWCDDQEMELSEGGIVFLPKKYRTATGSPRTRPICS